MAEIVAQGAGCLLHDTGVGVADFFDRNGHVSSEANPRIGTEEREHLLTTESVPQMFESHCCAVVAYAGLRPGILARDVELGQLLLAQHDLEIRPLDDDEAARFD